MIRLIVGGARSGKSSFAQSFYETNTDVVYLATSRVEDEEMKWRIEKHKQYRPSSWRTYEGTYDLYQSVSFEKFYLLDCVTVLTSNIMYDYSKNHMEIEPGLQQQIEEKTIQVLLELILEIQKQNADLIIITNEVGCSIVPYHPISRAYTDILGRVNQYLAKTADEVYAMICGIPTKIK